MARIRLLFACLALVTPLVPATANAAPLPATGLVLSVRPEMGRLSTTQLRCEPAGGLHKNAKEACDALLGVDGDFTKMEDTGLMCTMELNVTKASLRGTWRGKQVRYTSEYSNPCQLRAFTGKVFDF